MEAKLKMADGRMAAELKMAAVLPIESTFTFRSRNSAIEIFAPFSNWVTCNSLR